MLSKHKFPGTIVYAALSGEEQGLLGGKILADYAKAQGWQVEAKLNNDIVGNSCGSDGVCDDKHVRVFSEGPRGRDMTNWRAQTAASAARMTAPSRNMSRFLDRLAERLAESASTCCRSGAPTASAAAATIPSSSNAGFPAVRFTVAIENYDCQHQDLRTENGIKYGDTIEEMDFPYLAKVTQLNVAAMAALASAPMPPEPTVEGAVSTDTTLKWQPCPAPPTSSLAADQCRRIGSEASKFAGSPASATGLPGELPVRAEAESAEGADPHLRRACSRGSASTIGCSGSLRFPRTGSKARLHPLCPAARSCPTLHGRWLDARWRGAGSDRRYGEGRNRGGRRAACPPAERRGMRRLRRAIPANRREALPGVRTCVACQAERDKAVVHSAINRRGSKDSQLRGAAVKD